MKPKKIVFVIIINFFIAQMHSQTIMNKDSLLSLIKTKKDTALVNLYINLSQQYEGSNMDSAKYFCFKARDLSKKIDYKIGSIKFISNFTYFLNIEGKLDESLKLNQEGLKIALSIKDKVLIAKAYANIGASYQYSEKYEAAMTNYLLAEKYFDMANYKSNIGVLYSNIGVIYTNLNQNEKALRYFNKSEKMATISNSKNELATALVNKSIALLDLKRYTEAEKVLQKALQISHEIKNDYVHTTALLNMGDLKIKTHQYNELKYYADQALFISKKIKNPESEINALKALGIYYLHKKKYSLANQFMLKSLIIAKEYESLDYQYKAYNSLKDISMAQHDFSLADDYAFTADSIESVINLNEVGEKIEEIKEKFETEKKELQIKNLSKQNQIEQLKSTQRFWIAMSLGILLLSLIYFSYKQYKNFKNKKALMLVQKENALTEERLRIATDMHDDIGSGLSTIRYIVGTKVNQDSDLKKVITISDDAVQKMNEIIWSLNKQNHSLKELLFFIKSQISEITQNHSIQLICKIPEDIPDIIFGWKRNRNTYLLVKETVNNAVKHAEAKTIEVKFLINETLNIEIIDDGKGFDLTQKTSGNGLENYKTRTHDLQATYNIKSEIGAGTSVQYSIPLKV